jgi:integrase
MANRKVTLIRNCKTPDGWKRYTAAIGKNGRVRPEWVKVGTKLEHFPTGFYEARYYEGSKVKYLRVSDNAQDALTECSKHAKVLIARDSAQIAGAKLVEEASRVTLRKALDLFLESVENKGSMVAHATYRRECEKFLEGMPTKRFLDELDKDDLTRFCGRLRKDGYEDRTIHNRHNDVAAFLRHAGKRDLVGSAPRFEKTLPEIYSQAEMTAFFESLTDERDIVAYRMAQMLGLREKEIMHSEPHHVDFAGSIFRVRSNPRWGFKIKDYEERDVPIPELLLGLLSKRVKALKGTLLVGTKSDKPEGHFLRKLKVRSYRANLHCGVCEGCRIHKECERWYLHKFRATYITHLLRNGVDIRSVMKLSGHADIESVMAYLRPAEDESLVSKLKLISW